MRLFLFFDVFIKLFL